MDDQSDQPWEPEGMPSAEELKLAILGAIGTHLRELGPKDWHLLRERPEYAHVIGAHAGKSGERKFWRWVGKVREDMPADHTRPHHGRDANQEHREWSAHQAHQAAESLPVPPPAAFFMRQGAGGVETIRIFEATSEVWRDLLAAKAMIDASDDKPSLKAKRITENAVARTKVMKTVMEMLDAAHDMDAQHHRYGVMIASVEKRCARYPGLLEALLRDFAEANAQPIPIAPLTH